MRLKSIMKVSRPAGVLWLGHAGPVVIKLLSYQSQPGVRGYRQRLHAFWKEKRLFQVGEQSFVIKRE